MKTRSNTRRDKTPIPEGYEVTRPKIKPRTLSPISAVKKRIEDAVLHARPSDLDAALSIQTRQSAQMEYGIFEKQRLFLLLLLPANEQYVLKGDELKACLRILKQHFRLPYDLFNRIVRDRRQFSDLVGVLFEGNEMKATDLERVAYTAMVYERDRVLKAIMDHPNFVINMTPTFTPPALSHKLLHYALKENGPNTGLVHNVLDHPDLDPDTRSVVDNVWATGLGTAHIAYSNSISPGETKRAASYVRTLLRRGDVDVHKMADGRDADIEAFDLFGVLVNNEVQAVHPQ